jgi:predicted PurR-regulated permease PerM
MAVLLSSRQRAALLIAVLGLGLLLALAPYASGLIGGLVLTVIFAPVHNFISRRVPARTSAAGMVLLALVVLVVPAVSFAGLLVGQAQTIANGIMQGPLIGRLSALEIGGVPVGPALAGMGQQLAGWLGSSALGLVGHATRLGLSLTIALFILYYLLLHSRDAWATVRPYIPFSPTSADLLRDRFRDVTVSTVIGTGLIAVIQGTAVGIGFFTVGLPNALFWGVVTVLFSILPVVGSGLVWVPGAASLALDGRYGAAIALVVLGLVVVANVDVLIRPAVFRKFAQVHPLVTLVGAIGGVGYFGLLGILIGPLALSYFFELIRMYQAEYLESPAAAVPPSPGVPGEPL